jgi:hypothetical protein
MGPGKVKVGKSKACGGVAGCHRKCSVRLPKEYRGIALAMLLRKVRVGETLGGATLCSREVPILF